MSQEELEKLTATKLREMAKEYPSIQGAHAMKKEDLIVAILEARGEPIKKAEKKSAKISEIKKQIRALKKEKAKSLQEKDKLKTEQLRKKIKTLKKQTRRLASQQKAVKTEEVKAS